MNKTYDKICKYCGDPFQAKRSNQEYCSSTHAKYEYEARKGQRERPARQINGSGYVPLTENEISARRSEIEELNKQIQDLNTEINLLKEEDELNFYHTPNYKVLELLQKKIRAIEKMKSITRSLIDPNNMTGDEIKEYAKSKMIYPFSEYEFYDIFFQSLGDLHQPFRAVIIGDEGAGKTILGLKITNHLIRHLKAKVLFVCSKDQENSALKYTQYYDYLNQNFSLRVFSSEQEIRAELIKEDYEFLIVDPIAQFFSHKQFFQDMLFQHPRLSIIGTANKTTSQMSTVFDIRFNIDVVENCYSTGEHKGMPFFKYSTVIPETKNKGPQIKLEVYRHNYKTPLANDFFVAKNFEL